MQKSSKIAWTIVTILVGGIILYNLDFASGIGKLGYLVGLVMIVAIAAIWRRETEKK